MLKRSDWTKIKIQFCQSFNQETIGNRNAEISSLFLMDKLKLLKIAVINSQKSPIESTWWLRTCLSVPTHDKDRPLPSFIHIISSGNSADNEYTHISSAPQGGCSPIPAGPQEGHINVFQNQKHKYQLLSVERFYIK